MVYSFVRGTGTGDSSANPLTAAVAFISSISTSLYTPGIDYLSLQGSSPVAGKTSSRLGGYPLTGLSANKTPLKPYQFNIGFD